MLCIQRQDKVILYGLNKSISPGLISVTKDSLNSWVTHSPYYSPATEKFRTN